MLAALLALAAAQATPVPSETPASPTPGPTATGRTTLAVVVRIDALPVERRPVVEPILRALARTAAVDDLHVHEAPDARIAELGEPRRLDACATANAERILDVEALEIGNESAGAHGRTYGEIHLTITDCVRRTVVRSYDDTMGHWYENVDRLSTRDYRFAFEEVSRYVLSDLRQH
jgi:hypothetical protein